MQWLNPPTHWSHLDNRLTVKTLPKTDFWRVTHYGFIRDTGHFYFDPVTTDFVVEVDISGDYKTLYDQAGIMIRSDDRHWIKTGIEYVDGVQHLSAVVTHDYSDWSMTPLPSPPALLHLKVERQKDTVQISYTDESGASIPLRLAYFPISPTIQVGIMCASPEGDGFDVAFENYQLSAL